MYLDEDAVSRLLKSGETTICRLMTSSETRGTAGGQGLGGQAVTEDPEVRDSLDKQDEGESRGQGHRDDTGRHGDGAGPGWGEGV